MWSLRTKSVIAALALPVLSGGSPAHSAQTTPGQKCAVAKIKAAFKKAAAKGACYQKAVGKGVGVDADCLAKAEAAFAAAFQKAESKGGCATIGDAAAIEAVVNAFVTGIVTALPPVPTTTTTTTTLPPCGASAPACNGTCPDAEAHCGAFGPMGSCVCGLG